MTFVTWAFVRFLSSFLPSFLPALGAPAPLASLKSAPHSFPHKSSCICKNALPPSLSFLISSLTTPLEIAHTHTKKILYPPLFLFIFLQILSILFKILNILFRTCFHGAGLCFIRHCWYLERCPAHSSTHKC
uniref:Secreted protein n=1 Tax=Myotis myotis TaxID=51298 RepID=A0A7J7Z5Q6_MYOMY|nr:hypothetical protein mMyoMyo1_010776 [Myotis myotis]